MATIPAGLKKLGRYWHFELKVNGQRVHGSTRATDLPTARMVMEEKRREILHDQLNITKKVIPTLIQVWDSWWNAHKTTFSRGHLVSAECRFRRWIKPTLGASRADQITTEQALVLRDFQLAEGCSPRYANNTTELLRTLLRFAVSAGHLDRLPFRVKPIRIQRVPRPTIPSSRLSAFVRAAEGLSSNLQVGVMLKVMVGLGLREGELLGMRWEWVDLVQETYTVGKAKGKEARVIPIPGWILSALVQVPRSSGGWVFPARDGIPHRSGFLKKPLACIATELGLGRLSQHRLRATFASLHAEVGTPITEVQGMLGHKSIQTTMIYVEQSLAAKRKAQDALSIRLGLN